MPRRIHQYEHHEPELGDTSHLSPRQRDVVNLLRKGMSNPEIAAELGISLDTATSHINNLKDRFYAHNKADLICQMWIHGILERPPHDEPCCLHALCAGRHAFRKNFSPPCPARSPGCFGDAGWSAGNCGGAVMNPLTYQFHRAQARLKSNSLLALTTRFRGQSEVALSFFEPATGDAAFYEVPAYIRKRIHSHDFDNRCRVAQYADRVRAFVQEVA